MREILGSAARLASGSFGQINFLGSVRFHKTIDLHLSGLFGQNSRSHPRVRLVRIAHRYPVGACGQISTLFIAASSIRENCYLEVQSDKPIAMREILLAKQHVLRWVRLA